MNPLERHQIEFSQSLAVLPRSRGAGYVSENKYIFGVQLPKIVQFGMDAAEYYQFSSGVSTIIDHVFDETVPVKNRQNGTFFFAFPCGSDAHAVELGQRLLDMLRDLQAQVGPFKIALTPKICATLIIDDEQSAIDTTRSILENAPENRVTIAADSPHSLQTAQIITLQDVAWAVYNDEITYFAQPIWDTDRHRVIGFEALVRWLSPLHGIVPPDRFLPALLELQRDDNVASALAAKKRECVAKLGAFPDCYIAFNHTLDEFRVPEQGRQVINDYQVIKDHPNRKIVIEITDTALNTAVAKTDLGQTMREMVDAGLSFALDDFGTQASNFARLTALPFEIMKIDKSLVDQITTDPKAFDVLQVLARYAQSQHMDVIVEGVETAAQSQRLIDIGLTKHQGYFYAKPMPIDAITITSMQNLPHFDE